MNTDIEASIVIAWWNTSLSPMGKSQANERERQIAAQIVNLLIDSVGVDCLAVGEVTRDDLEYLVNSCPVADITIFDGTHKAGRLQFDIGIIFNKRRLNVMSSQEIIDSHGGHSLKVAHRIDFNTLETNGLLHLFVLHWPSRIWCRENGAMRDVLGIRLHDYVNDLKRTYINKPQIIIIGDFNDEPFDQPLAGHLLASRDRTLVSKGDVLFYNPFWRHLGETSPYLPGVASQSIGGTYYYHKSNEETRWRTFDQIIFSSSFLGGNQWHLNEAYTTIFQHHSFNELVLNPKEIFDHLPIVSVIQKRLDAFSEGGKP